MAQVMGVSRSGFYTARKRGDSVRHRENQRLVMAIRATEVSCRGVYGSPRMTVELNNQGYRCGRNRVARLMSENGISAKTVRRFKVTTVSRHSLPVAPNLLNQTFTANAPHRVWAGDITYIRTGEGWLYLAMVKDLFTKGIVGWAMGDRLGSELVSNALIQALNRYRPLPGLIFHSDRGVQYACRDFCTLLAKYQVRQSMSGQGNCYDNAISETFFSTLKRELINRTWFSTRSSARIAIFEYIELFYNRRRLHSGLGYFSPNEFERLHQRD